MEKAVILVLISIFLLSNIDHFISGEKILFYFGGGSYSHKSSVWSWASELADRGHQITFLSAHEKKPTDTTKIKDLSSQTLHKLMSDSYDVDRFSERKEGKETMILSSYSQTSIQICEAIFDSENDIVLQTLLKEKSFDLIIVNIIFGECGFVLSAVFKAKTIIYDASVPLSWFYDLYGFSADSSWIPDILNKYDNFPLTFADRFNNAFRPLYWYWDRYTVLYPALEKVMKKALNSEQVPSFYEMERNVSLIVVNTHPAVDFAYSLPPFVISVAGMQSWLPEKAIPHMYQKFMDDAGGVVLISFGSTVRLEKVSAYFINIFFSVIKKHQNIRFLMKWKGPYPKEFESGLDNLMISDWLPQRELLRHPKLRAFITHGGLNSMQEATFYGVPLIVLPLFADQDYNAYRVEVQGVGFRLEIRELTVEIMDNALNRVLNDVKFKRNMETKSRIFRDRPMPPLQNVLYWTEFVLRHDDCSSLKPMSNDLTWYQRRLLDVYAVYFLILLGVPFIFLIIVVKVFSRIFLISNSKRVKAKRS